MAEISQDFEMYSGESKIISFSITGDDGNLKNLTGCVITWILVGSTITKSTIGGAIQISGSNANVILQPSDTVNKIGSFVHQMRVIDTNSDSEIVATGTAKINTSYL